MKFISKYLTGTFLLLVGCNNEQSFSQNTFSEYASTLIQYETNLFHIATYGQNFWGDIFIDTRISISRKIDLVNMINNVSQPNEKMNLKIQKIIISQTSKMNVDEKNPDYEKWKFIGLLEIMRERHDFHEAFIMYNYIDKAFLYSLPENVGSREIAVLTETTALHGKKIWSTILTDKNIDINLKQGLVMDIHDMAKYGEYYEIYE